MENITSVIEDACEYFNVPDRTTCVGQCSQFLLKYGLRVDKYVKTPHANDFPGIEYRDSENKYRISIAIDTSRENWIKQLCFTSVCILSDTYSDIKVDDTYETFYSRWPDLRAHVETLHASLIATGNAIF